MSGWAGPRGESRDGPCGHAGWADRHSVGQRKPGSVLGGARRRRRQFRLRDQMVVEPHHVHKVTAFSGSWRLSDNAHAVFRTLLRALDAAPDTMGSQLILSTTAATTKSPWRYQITLACEFHGPKADFDSILGAALAAADRAEERDCWFKNCSTEGLAGASLLGRAGILRDHRVAEPLSGDLGVCPRDLRRPSARSSASGRTGPAPCWRRDCRLIARRPGQ